MINHVQARNHTLDTANMAAFGLGGDALMLIGGFVFIFLARIACALYRCYIAVPERFVLGETLFRSPHTVITRAHDSVSNKCCVVKRALSSQSRAYLLNEQALLTGHLANCECVPRVLYAGKTFTVLEPVGCTLKQICERLEPDQRHAFAHAMKDRLFSVLDEIHQRFIVHRDINPNNILCMDNGNIILIDWGQAFYVSNEPVHVGGGTVGYASKRMLDGDVPSFRDDIHAVLMTVRAIREGIPEFENKAAREFALTRRIGL